MLFELVDGLLDVEAVLYLGRMGVGWRDLPPHMGHWHRVYVLFARWRESGVGAA